MLYFQAWYHVHIDVHRVRMDGYHACKNQCRTFMHGIMVTLTEIMFKGMINECTVASCLHERASDGHHLCRDRHHIYRVELHDLLSPLRACSHIRPTPRNAIVVYPLPALRPGPNCTREPSSLAPRIFPTSLLVVPSSCFLRGSSAWLFLEWMSVAFC